MKIDVSEIKSFKACKRQWMLSSRNRYHLRPTTTAKALEMGTLFHEALAQLYSGADYDKVIALVEKERTKDEVALKAMLKGYYDVLMEDLERMNVLEVEYRFNFESDVPDVECVGAIDLIALEYTENGPVLYGYEHKTAGQFREQTLIKMDEQPRLYFEALELYLDNAIYEGCVPRDTCLGGIYINEIKKLIRR